MKIPDDETRPCWNVGLRIPQFAPPEKSEPDDVCVVGAGIAGLTTAYLLCRDGKSVVLLDERAIGSGQTGRTSAHLASALDDRFVEIERLHGIDSARLAWQSHDLPIDTIERIAADEKIGCDFSRVDGLLSAGESGDRAALQREFDAARRAGFPGVALCDSGGLADHPCIAFLNQAVFHLLTPERSHRRRRFARAPARFCARG